jgi:conjugal transfer/entry exclusion protein
MAWSDATTIEKAAMETFAISWKYAREIQPVNPRIAEIERDIQRLQNELETLKEVSK